MISNLVEEELEESKEENEQESDEVSVLEERLLGSLDLLDIGMNKEWTPSK